MAKSPHQDRIEELRLSMYALMLQLSANMELVLEIVVMRELNLSVAQSCVICGSLGGGAKTSVALSLSALSGKHPDLAAAIAAFQTIASRNMMAHGFIHNPDQGDDWFLVQREVKKKLTIKKKDLDDHLTGALSDAFEVVQAATGVTDKDIQAYAGAIAALAPSP